MLAGASGPTAPAAAATPVRRLPKHAPNYAPNFVLVRFKSTPTAAGVAAVQAKAPVVPGLQLVSLTGEHQDIWVPSGSAPAAAAAAAAPLPANAIMKFRITDGSKVEAKVKQLQANPGAGVAGSRWGKSGRWYVRNSKCACPPSSVHKTYASACSFPSACSRGARPAGVHLLPHCTALPERPKICGGRPHQRAVVSAASVGTHRLGHHCWVTGHACVHGKLVPSADYTRLRGSRLAGEVLLCS